MTNLSEAVASLERRCDQLTVENSELQKQAHKSREERDNAVNEMTRWRDNAKAMADGKLEYALKSASYTQLLDELRDRRSDAEA